MAQRLSREELIELVEKIRRVENSEEEIDAMLDLLEWNVPDPEVSNLIYWSKEDLTSEQIVDRALSYKPILLPGRQEPPAEGRG